MDKNPNARDTGSRKATPQEMPSRRRRILGRLIGAAAVLAILAVGAYFYATSALFFEQWLQPAIEKALQRPVKAEGYRLSALGSLQLKALRVEPLEGEEQAPLAARGVDVRWSPTALLGRRLEVQHLRAESLSVHIVRGEDGALLFPPAAAKADRKPRDRGGEKPPAEERPRDAGDGWKVALRNVSLADVNLSYRDESIVDADGRAAEVRVSGLTFEAPFVAPDRAWEARSEARLAAYWPAAPDAGEETSTAASQDVQAAFSALLTHEPTESGARQVGIDARVSEVTGTLGGQALENASLTLDALAEIDRQGETRINKASLQVVSDNTLWAQAGLTGAWNPTDQSGNVNVRIGPLDRRVLNLMAPPGRGIDFRDTRVETRLEAIIRAGAELETLDLEADVANLNPTGNDLPAGGLPTTDGRVRLVYRAPADAAEATIEEFEATLRRKDGATIVSASLSQPLPIDPKTFIPPPDRIAENALTVNVPDLDLAEWAPLLPQTGPLTVEKGNVSLTLQLGKGSEADTVVASGEAVARGLAGRNASADFGPLDIETSLAARARPSGELLVERLSAKLRNRDGQLAQVSGTGRFDAEEKTGDASLAIAQVDIAALARLAGKAAAVEPLKGSAEGEIRLSMKGDDGQVGFDTRLNISNLHLRNRAPHGGELTDLDATWAGQGRLVKSPDHGRTLLEVASANISARLDGQPLATLSAQCALDLDLFQGRIQADCVDLDLLPLLRFQDARPESPRPLEASLDSHLEADLENDDRIAIKGHAEVSPLRLPGRGESAPPVSLPVRAEADLVAHPRTGAAEVTMLRLATGEGDGEGSLTAEGRLAWGESSEAGLLKVQAANLDLAPLQSLAPAIAERADLSGARLAGQQDIRFGAGGKAGDASGALKLTGLRPPATKRSEGRTPPPLNIDIENKLALAEKALTIERVALTIPAEADRASQTVLVTGSLAVNDPDPENALLLQVTADRLELQPLMAFGNIEPAPDAPPLVLTNLETRVRQSRTVSSLEHLSAGLNNATLGLVFVAVGIPGDGPPLIRWEGLEAAQLDIAALVANFAPELQGKLDGRAKVSSTGSLSPASTSEATLASLRGVTQVDAMGGYITRIPFTRELARVTGLSELERLEFRDVVIRVEGTPEATYVREARLTAPRYRMQTSGPIEHDGSLDLPLELALGPEITKRIGEERIARALKADEEGFSRFPVPIAVGGTLEDPRMKLTLPTRSILEMGVNILEQELREDRDEEEPEDSADETETPAAAPEPAAETAGGEAALTPVETRSDQPIADDVAPTPTPEPEEDDRSDREKLEDVGVEILRQLPGILDRK